MHKHCMKPLYNGSHLILGTVTSEQTGLTVYCLDMMAEGDGLTSCANCPSDLMPPPLSLIIEMIVDLEVSFCQSSKFNCLLQYCVSYLYLFSFHIAFISVFH